MTESILIVDDSTFIVEGLVALLKRNYTPIPSYGGEECLEILRTKTPSLIILDIMMEPMDGWETLARIKGNPKTRYIPVLMFSAKKISPEEAETHRIIIDDFLTKPVNPKKLIEAIEKVLARQESNKQTISSWEAAGVSREIIDEYLTIKTNIDVDASLLAVMNKQLEMAHPDSENRGELERSIVALTSRIAESRASLESFCHKQSGFLPVQDPVRGTVPPPDAMPRMDPARPEPVPSLVTDSPEKPPATGSPSLELQSPSPESLPPAPPAPKDEEIVAKPVEAPPPERTEPVLTPPVSPVVSPPVTGIVPPVPGPEDGIEPAPDATRDSTPEIPPVAWPEVPAPRFSLPGPDAARNRPDANSLFEPFEEPSGTNDPFRQPVPEELTIIVPPEARPEKITRPPAVLRPGGGTPTPSMLSPVTTRREAPGPVKDAPSPEQPKAASGGFFSRLIAAITAIFSKKKS